jgi:hypothetical protein
MNTLRVGALSAGLFTAVAFGGSVAVAADASAPAGTTGGDAWRFVIVPYAWLTSLSGDVTVKGQTASADASIADVLNDLNIAAFIAADAHKGRFGLYGNVQYANLSSKSTVAGIGIKTTSETVIVGFGASYQIGTWDLDPDGGPDGPTVTVSPYVGGRFTYLNAELDFRDIRTFRDDVAWVDPVIGIRSRWDLSPRWTALASGDVGGFGVGSDFTWQAFGTVSYRFSLLGDDDADAIIGYRALGQDYSSGSFRWDVVQHGPVLGLAVRF